MRILVNQTTRMGDTLQSSPMIHALRRAHPDAHITLLVRKMGKTVAERHPDVDAVWIYEEDGIYLAVRSDDSGRLLDAYREAEALVERIRAAHFDCAYNLSHSTTSAQVLALAEIPDVYGAHLSQHGHFVLRGPWTTYFFTSVLNREYNDLNLCDILRCSVPGASTAPNESKRLLFEGSDADRSKVAALLSERGVSPEERIVAMQLGASEVGKQWPPESFAALAQQIRERWSVRIVLVGVPDESVLGDRFEAAAPGVAEPLFGATSLPQLAALLERCTLLVTNDTGTMHVAAAAACPVVLVSVGHVHFRETGPYGVGHWAVDQRRDALGSAAEIVTSDAERAAIPPEAILIAVDRQMEACNDPVDPGIPHTQGLDFYRSDFAPDGCLQFLPKLRRPLAHRDAIRIAYRAMWLAHLNGTREVPGELETMRQSIDAFAPAAGEPDSWLADAQQGLAHANALAQRGVSQCAVLLDTLRTKQSMSEAKRQVAALMALDTELAVAGELHPACKPLSVIARYERDNLEGDDPQALAEATRIIYERTEQRASLLAEKLERVAKLLAGATA